VQWLKGFQQRQACRRLNILHAPARRCWPEHCSLKALFNLFKLPE
jgi:hypothetical protein